MQDSFEKTQVIYIMGAGRSGSSILGEAIGMLPRTLHLGEILGIFDYCLDKNEKIVCSCGNFYEKCPFWNKLMVKTFGDEWKSVIIPFRVLGKLPTTKKILFEKIFHGSVFSEINTMSRINFLLKNALSITNSEIIVDSSKSIPYAILMKNSPLFNIFLIHLVRDPRAVLYSWLHRPIQIYDEDQNKSILRTRTLIEGAFEWIYSDIGAHILRLFGYPFIEVLYEDFIKNPEEIIQNIMKAAKQQGIFLEYSEEIINRLYNKKVDFQGHWSGGNPRLKNKSGLNSIEIDNHWVSDRTIAERFLANLLFFPWLIYYGYYWS